MSPLLLSASYHSRLHLPLRRAEILVKMVIYHLGKGIPTLLYIHIITKAMTEFPPRMYPSLQYLHKSDMVPSEAKLCCETTAMLSQLRTYQPKLRVLRRYSLASSKQHKSVDESRSGDELEGKRDEELEKQESETKENAHPFKIKQDVHTDSSVEAELEKPTKSWKPSKFQRKEQRQAAGAEYYQVMRNVQ